MSNTTARKPRRKAKFPASRTVLKMDGPPAMPAAPPTTPADSQLPPLRPNRFMATTAEVSAEMNTVFGKLQAMQETASGEKRTFTDLENAEYNRNVEYFEFLRDQETPRVKKMEELARHHSQQLPRHPALQGQGRQPLMNPGGAMPGYHHEMAAVRRPRVTKRLRTFRAELFGGDTMMAYDAAEQAGHWLKAYLWINGGSKIKESIPKPVESLAFCKDHEHLQFVRFEEAYPELMAQVEGTPSLGGYLVPEIVLATVIDVRDRFGLAPNITRRYPMAGETDLIPKRETGLTVEKPGENNPIDESTKTWSQLRLAAVDAYTLTPISAKLLRGAVVDAAEQVISEIGYAFARQLDYEMIAADGTAGKPNFGKTGLLDGVAAGGIHFGTGGGTGWASIQVSDIDVLIGMLPDKFDNQGSGGVAENWAADNVPRFIMPRALFFEFIEPLMESRAASKSDVSERSPRQLRGYPVHFSEWMPRDRTATDTGAIAFGNFYEGFQLGERQVVTIAISEHNQFHLDNIVIRGKSAWDLNFHEAGDAVNPGAVVLLKTAT